MVNAEFVPGKTALVFIDPYNDFLSEGGKLLPIFIAPHHRAAPGEFDGWDHPTPYQLGASQMQVFAKGSWGGEWHPDFAPQPGDIVVKEHWGGSSFANTDLDLLLKQKGVTRLIIIGLIANTCVETTARFAADLGYHVTLVRDATAAFSMEAMHAAHEINAPNFVHALVTTAELLDAFRNPSSASVQGAIYVRHS